jgi:hypothetical protein
MLHDVAIFFVFLAMLIAPCAVTLGFWRENKDAPVPPSRR